MNQLKLFLKWPNGLQVFEKSRSEEQHYINFKSINLFSSPTLSTELQSIPLRILNEVFDTFINSSNVAAAAAVTVSDSNIVDTTWYKGSNLDVNWLLQIFTMLKNVKFEKNSGLKCTFCFD